jgi:transcriptional regulator with XRE-family HTH domain
MNQTKPDYGKIINRTLAMTFRAQRQWLHLNLEDVAERTMMSRKQLLDLEKNRTSFDRESVSLLSTACEITPIHLIHVLLQAIETLPLWERPADPLLLLEPYF